MLYKDGMKLFLPCTKGSMTPAYAQDTANAKSPAQKLRNNILSCRYPNETSEACLERKIDSCGSSPAYASSCIPTFRKAACRGVGCVPNSIRIDISISIAVRNLGEK